MLETVGTNIWVAEGACVNFMGFPYSTRSAIVRLQSGALWVWSPIALSSRLRTQIDALGPVRYLVGPNKIHHLFLKEWAEAYPQATLWAPQSLIDKRKDLNFGEALTEAAPEAWRSEIEQAWFNGSPFMDEIVFFHRESRTAILADLSENFSKSFLEANWKGWQRMIARLWGIVEGKGYAPLEWRVSFLNRKATRQSRDRVFGWNPENVIMAHGVRQEGNGLTYLEKAFSWMG